MSSQDKELPATDRRLQQARSDGQVARSKDLTNFAVLGGGMLLLMALMPFAFPRMLDALRTQLTFDHTSLLKGDLLTTRLAAGAASGVTVYLPLGLAVLVFAVGVTVAAGGWAVSTKPLMPDITKLSPLAGFGRIFSKQQFFEVIKLSALTLVMAFVGWTYLAAHLLDFATLLLRPLDSGIPLLGRWLSMGVGFLLLVVGLMAAVDVPLSAFLHKQRLRMSHEEVKQEHKEVEGNPQLKGRMRALQREASQRSSVSAVPKADLVVMNPTHYAVAIRYDDATMSAPRVIAKGADLIAMQIRDMAKKHEVPVLQSPMLARALYAHAEIDSEIPAVLYAAVAQVLAYVYQLKAALKGKGPMPIAQPVPDVPVELDPHHQRRSVDAPETENRL
jgi:flagellar biosynthetic protein FlhB